MSVSSVALFTRAWIEIVNCCYNSAIFNVALFTRAWIEIPEELTRSIPLCGRPLHEGVD